MDFDAHRSAHWTAAQASRQVTPRRARGEQPTLKENTAMTCLVPARHQANLLEAQL
jgi:hypothetical protein